MMKVIITAPPNAIDALLTISLDDDEDEEDEMDDEDIVYEPEYEGGPYWRPLITQSLTFEQMKKTICPILHGDGIPTMNWPFQPEDTRITITILGACRILGCSLRGRGA